MGRTEMIHKSQTNYTANILSNLNVIFRNACGIERCQMQGVNQRKKQTENGSVSF